MVYACYFMYVPHFTVSCLLIFLLIFSMGWSPVQVKSISDLPGWLICYSPAVFQLSVIVGYIFIYVLFATFFFVCIVFVLYFSCSSLELSFLNLEFPLPISHFSRDYLQVLGFCQKLVQAWAFPLLFHQVQLPLGYSLFFVMH